MREGGGWEDGGTKGRREKRGFGSTWWWSPQDELDVGGWERREGKEKNKR